MISKVKDQMVAKKNKSIKRTKLIITTKYINQKDVFGDWQTQKYHLTDAYILGKSKILILKKKFVVKLPLNSSQHSRLI